MKKYFYIDSNDQQVGPLTIDELKKSNITVETLIWYDELNNWTELKNLKELRNNIIVKPPEIKNNFELFINKTSFILISFLLFVTLFFWQILGVIDTVIEIISLILDYRFYEISVTVFEYRIILFILNVFILITFVINEKNKRKKDILLTLSILSILFYVILFINLY